MKEYVYLVTVECASKKEADQVMAERIYYEEDYGFEYSVDFTYSRIHNDDYALELPEDDGDCETCGDELLWDDQERMYYCPNTWEHG